jgi:3-dehydrotetronate 4-kinase
LIFRILELRNLGRYDMSNLLIGCFGDDFTGSSDAASFIKKAGLNTLLINGVPEDDMVIPEDVEAIVIALKTRTEEVNRALEESMAAFEWLKSHGIEHIYDKYCSTFDSTKVGNIGPIIDAILEKYALKYTILCPALPINKRIVKDGILYVDGVPLAQSHMRNHPLTPMLESDIEVLMKPQGKYSCFKLNYKMLELQDEIILEHIEDFGRDKEHFYVITDYVEERQAKKIARLFGDLNLLTGGSGLITELAKHIKACNINNNGGIDSRTSGKAIIFAGSCSNATLSQINAFISSNGTAIKIDPRRLLRDDGEMERIWDYILQHGQENVLIYSSGSPSEVAECHQLFGREKVSEKLEQSMAEIAQRAVHDGYKRIIVAGGETSGAITKKIGFNSYYIGEDIAPGVPIMVPIQDSTIRLVLKSGNFGQEDFFLRALNMTGK